jgi:flagellar hook-associated protein 3 FlgL
MSSGTAGSPTAQAALATEVSSIQQELVGLGNTTYLNRPVFGGTTAGATAYDSNGNYVGDGGQVTRTVGDNDQVRVDITGPEAFGTGNTQIFQVVGDIASHLKSDPSQLGADLDRLDAAAATMQNQLSSIGARYNRITTAQQNSTDLTTTLTGNLSQVEDVDLPKTITDLQMQQVAYQAALGATAKVVQPSLVDFLQ